MDSLFSVDFKCGAVKREKRLGLLRNAALALGDRDYAEAIAALRHALNDSDELVREQAERSLIEIIKRRSKAEYKHT